MGKTNRPIIPKHTVLKELHIHVLQRFLVDFVDVSPKLSDGEPYVPEEKIQMDVIHENNQAKDSFADLYLKAVKEYKKWFSNWQAGSPINIQTIRNTIVPLLEAGVESNNHIVKLHHYSTKDEYLYHHSVSSALIASFLAKKMNLERGEWIQVGLAALLSDCGMAKIDPKILFKQGSLTEAEYDEVKQHPKHSYRMVESIPALSKGAKLGILQHHERLDGSGYPFALKSEKLHIFSGIIAVSDMYHAMTSERLYRAKQSPFKVLEEMMKAQFGRFNHEIVQTFITHMTNFSTGTKVKLSNNDLGEVVFIESSQPTRPMVRLQQNEEIIHLKNHLDVYIEEVVG
ncbi:HD-GYP domain-containing protein [Thalassobacillus hwangdonensis]|uniref:HD-GYP domain-containing protein n=2 Tax=Thalassobacillus hwangdonensis TaxID=546108 RepID=A0ABW3L1L5_9BACI